MWIARVSDFLTYLWLFGALFIGYGPKKDWRVSAGIGLLLAFAGSGLILLQEKVYPSYAVYQLTYVLCGILFSVLALKGQTGPKITTAMYYCALFFLLYSVIFWLTPEKNQIAERALHQVFHMLLMAFVARRPLNSNRRVPAMYWVPILLACLLTMVIPLWPHDPFADDEVRTAVDAICMIVVLNITYALSGKLIRDSERQLVQRSLTAEDSAEAALEAENQRLQTSLRQARHETRNHVASLTALLEQGETREALQLLRDLNRPADTGKRDETGSGNALVDALFEQYAKKAEEAGISFRAEACLDAPVRVSNADLSSLLGNLLTNAFDASGRVDQPEVEARVLPAKDYLCVYVRNRADARLLKANPLLHTTKQNPELHGIGLQVVRQIAQRYHGWVDISAEGDWFTVQVMLLMEES